LLERGDGEGDDGAGLDGAHSGGDRLTVEPGNLADDLAGTKLADPPAARAAEDVDLEQAVSDEEDRLGGIVLPHQNAAYLDRLELGSRKQPVSVLLAQLLKDIQRNVAHVPISPVRFGQWGAQSVLARNAPRQQAAFRDIHPRPFRASRRTATATRGSTGSPRCRRSRPDTPLESGEQSYPATITSTATDMVWRLPPRRTPLMGLTSS
jgi:hypothetical protein